MAAGASSAPLTNGTHATIPKPTELTISLPHNPGIRIHLRLSVLSTSIMLFLSNTTLDSSAQAAAMGSFVYAMPDRYNPNQPMSTPLYTSPSTLDFGTRMAKLLVKKTGKTAYVGNSINISGAVGGGTVEEEMEAFRAVAEVVTKQITGTGDTT